MALFVYVDESGDSGLKLGKSSDYIVFSMLMVDDPGPIHAAIEALRDRLSISRRMEFKFSKDSRPVRVEFLEELRRHDVAIRGLAVNKLLLPDTVRRGTKERFYDYLLTHALRWGRDDMGPQTKVVLDEFLSSKKARHELAARLRFAVNDGPDARYFDDITHRRSHTDNLVQAADMVAGAIYQSRARQDDSFLQVIRSRVRDIWDWEGDPT